jgi:hypothetical protein
MITRMASTAPDLSASSVWAVFTTATFIVRSSTMAGFTWLASMAGSTAGAFMLVATVGAATEVAGIGKRGRALLRGPRSNERERANARPSRPPPAPAHPGQSVVSSGLGYVQDTCNKWSQGRRLCGACTFRDFADDLGCHRRAIATVRPWTMDASRRGLLFRRLSDDLDRDFVVVAIATVRPWSHL